MNYIVCTQYELHCIHSAGIILYIQCRNYIVYIQHELHCIRTVWITLYTQYTQYELHCIHSAGIILYTHSMHYIVYTHYELHCMHTAWITLYTYNMNYLVYVRHNNVLWNCVQLCYICNEKPYTDQTKSSLCFIPSSDFIIGDNCKGGHYFTADTI